MQSLFNIQNIGSQVASGNPSLGARIRQLRHGRGWTLDQLAKESGVTKGFLSQVENEKTQPTGRVLLCLAKALGASVDWLLTGDVEGQVVEEQRAFEVPRELAQLAMERGWTARHVFAIATARQDLLARRSGDKPRKAVFTKSEWADFADRIGPYIEDAKE